MLKIERLWDYCALGHFVLKADFTIQTLHGLVDGPRETNKVFGSDETEFAAEISGFGAGGGHTTTAVGPVKYEVDGLFQPASGACVFDLVVTETLYLSRVTSVENTLFGSMPVEAGGLGADVVTTFQVEFDEESLDVFIIAGEHQSAFTLYDIALPTGTGCNF